MSPPGLILFDDDLPQLAPLNDLHAAFELTSGAVPAVHRIPAQLGLPLVGLCVSQRLAPVLAERFDLPVNDLPSGGPFLLVHGRLTSAPPDLPPFDHRLTSPDGLTLAATVDAQRLGKVIQHGLAALDDLPAEPHHCDLPLLERPWHLLDAVRRHLPDDLDHGPDLPADLLAPRPNVHRIGDLPVRLGHNVRLDGPLVLDTTAGPITIDHHAHLGPFCVVQGPAYVGPGSCVGPHSLLRPFTVIGPTCKVAGEISASLFLGYANKAHLGFLGDSIVGQWVNLGAATLTSNLKNTYGTIRFQGPADPRPIDTGRTFLGAVIGDHVKTAIGTRLLGGCCLGTGAMIACSGLAPKTVAPFAFLTDDGCRRYQWDKFCQVAQRVMQRRDRTFTQAQRRCLESLYVASTCPS